MTATAVNRSVHGTLSGTTPAQFTFRGTVSVEVMNRAGTDPIWITADGSTPVASAADTDIVTASGVSRIDVPSGATLALVGNGNTYSIIRVAG